MFGGGRACLSQLLTVNVAVAQFFPAAEMRAFAQALAATGVDHTHLEFVSAQSRQGYVSDTAAFGAQMRPLLDAPATALQSVPEPVRRV